MEELTEKQKNVLVKIIELTDQEHRPPTIRELAHCLKYHIKTVYQFLNILERKRALYRRKGRIIIAEEFRSEAGIPIVGRVAAGLPQIAEENREGCLSLTGLFGKSNNLFALKVHGDSMINVHINNGDYVVVRRQSFVENGEIGVALIDNEASVKRIRISGSIVKLIPENDSFDTIEFDTRKETVRILGKVVGIVKDIR